LKTPITAPENGSCRSPLNLTHPARAEQGQDWIVTERCADERILVSVTQSLGRHVKCRVFQE
jgi:hypothetical protein